MIKTIEELNREFLSEFELSHDNNTQHDNDTLYDVVTDTTDHEQESFIDNPVIVADIQKLKHILESKADDIDTNTKDQEVIEPQYDSSYMALDSEPTPVSTLVSTTSPSEASVRTQHHTIQTQPLWKDLMFLVLKIGMISLAFVALFTFLFGLIRYGEPSMSPAIKDGDLVIYHRYMKVGYLPQDPIVIEQDGQKVVRRVVATAGDVVDIIDDGLVVNGSMQQEPDIFRNTERYAEGVEFPLTVPDGHVFVLGDNRVGATDSRIYGPVSIDDTFGKVMAVIRRRSL